MCFGPGTLGAAAKPRLRTRNTEVYATLRLQARWDGDRVSVNVLGHEVRGTYVIDAGRYTVVVGH